MFSHMNLLMVIPALDAGGAEWAFVRQANALSASHAVTAYVPYACDSRPALMSAFESNVRVVSLPLPHASFHRVLYKLTLLFPRLALEQRLHRAVLGLLHRLERFQVVNSHLHSGTRLACDAFADDSVKIVETDHGDYALLKKEDPSLQRHAAVFARLDGVVCPSQANLDFIRDMPWRSGCRRTVIPYAAPCVQVDAKPRVTDSECFTFGLVARGVAEKGWAEALAAFRLLRASGCMKTRLLFVGDGPEIRRLRADVSVDEGVEFTGYQPDISASMARCDVGLLPSYFTAESLPNVIIEFQAQGKPVIATLVGGIPEMLVHDGQPSGIVIPISSSTGRADVAALALAMRRMMEDSDLCSRAAVSARAAFARYSPERCSMAYTRFFEEVCQKA